MSHHHHQNDHREPCRDPACRGEHQLGRILEIGPLEVHEMQPKVRPAAHGMIVKGRLYDLEFHVGMSESGDRLYLVRHDGSPLQILMIEEIIGAWLAANGLLGEAEVG